MFCLYLVVKSKMKLLLYRWSGTLTVSGLVAGEPEETGRASPLPADCISVPTVATIQPLFIILSGIFSDTRERNPLPAHTAVTALPEKTYSRNMSTVTILKCHTAVPTVLTTPHTNTFSSDTFAYTLETSHMCAPCVRSELHAKQP